jgi:hypothetical protein
MEDFSRLKDHIEKLGVEFLVRPALRFANSAHEHQPSWWSILPATSWSSGVTFGRSAATSLQVITIAR